MASAFKNKAVAAGTSPTTVYTVPAATTAVIHAIHLANIDGTNSVKVDITWVDTSATATWTLLYQAPLPAGSTLSFDKPVNLEATDVLKVTTSAAGDVHCTIAVLELT